MRNNHLKVCVLIPVYNNAGTIGRVIDGVRKFCADIIVVNDGSTDGTSENISRKDDLILFNFPENMGKGNALQKGFSLTAERGFTHVITMDGDGQHSPEDIPLFLDRINENPDKIWVGNRVIPVDDTVQPARSYWGGKFGSFWYRYITGFGISDTQCGFRSYPLSGIKGLKLKGGRFEFEQELLIKAAWNGVSVGEVDIHLIYISSDYAVSHFRPVKDFLRISAVNSKAAFIRTIFPVIAIEVPGDTWREKIIHLVKHELKAHTTPKRAAFSVSLGIFVGIFPIHGFQVLSILGLSLLLHLNRPLAFLGVCISSPPFLPIIIVFALGIGRLVLPPDLIAASNHSIGGVVLQGAIEFVVGSVLLAIIAGATSFILLYPVLKRLAKVRSEGGRNESF